MSRHAGCDKDGSPKRHGKTNDSVNWYHGIVVFYHQVQQAL